MFRFDKFYTFEIAQLQFLEHQFQTSVLDFSSWNISSKHQFHDFSSKNISPTVGRSRGQHQTSKLEDHLRHLENVEYINGTNSRTVKEFIRDILSCLTALNAIFGYLPGWEITEEIRSGIRSLQRFKVICTRGVHAPP